MKECVCRVLEFGVVRIWGVAGDSRTEEDMTKNMGRMIRSEKQIEGRWEKKFTHMSAFWVRATHSRSFQLQ